MHGSNQLRIMQNPKFDPSHITHGQTWFFFFFPKISIEYQKFEHVLKNKKQKFNFNFLTNPSIHIYKHTSCEIVC